MLYWGFVVLSYLYHRATGLRFFYPPKKKQAMPRISNCPPEASIETIPFVQCREAFRQTQRLIFSRLFDDAGNVNEILLADASIKATWEQLLAANDSTKISITPIINNPTSEPSEKIEFGTGNEVPDGVPQVTGSTPTAFSCYLASVDQASIVVPLKKLISESNLGAMIVNQYGQLGANKTKSNGGTGLEDVLTFFPIRGFHISDKVLGGLEEPDKNIITFSFSEDWSDGFHMLSPTFDALQLNPA